MPRIDPDEVKRFLRVAIQRYEEARYLFLGGRHACSIYLAGYSVECALKSLILSSIPRKDRKAVVDSFRGAGGHDLGRLYENHAERGGPRFPPSIAESFSYVTAWTTDLRYIPGERPFREAEKFLDSTEIVLNWIKGKL